MTSRSSISRTKRARVFDAANGICHLCDRRIQAGEKWDVEHVRSLALGGKDSEDNLRPAHVKCHRVKTSAEQTRIAKADRQRWHHLGIRKQSSRPLPGGRNSAWKKKMDGTVVRR